MKNKLLQIFFYCIIFFTFEVKSFAICILAKVGNIPITNYDVMQIGLFLCKNQAAEKSQPNKKNKRSKGNKYNKNENICDLKKSFPEYLQFLITLKLKELYINKLEVQIDSNNKDFLQYVKQVDNNIKFSEDSKIDRKLIINMLKNDFIWNGFVYQMKMKDIEKEKIQNPNLSENDINKILSEASMVLLSKIKDMTTIDILEVSEKDIFDI